MAVPGGHLRVSLFGGFALTTSDGAEIAISSRRARALLAMLCLSPGEAMERDHVSRLLWPGRFQEQARASLRQCLSGLDKVLNSIAPGVLDLSHGRIAIDSSRIDSDLARLETALAQGRAAEARGLLVAIGNRPLLDQMALGDVFEEWLVARRRQVERRLQDAIDGALARLGQDDHPAERNLLLDAWRACVSTLALRQDRKTRIAILPFRALDVVEGPFFLAEGVVEELTHRLGGASALAVVGRTSVMSVTGSGRTLPEMAGALNASHLIEGTVHRFPDGVRISVCLIDGFSGTEIWSDRYDGTLAEVMGSRSLLGVRFVAGVCAALEVDPPPAPSRTMTTSRDAYALYLQGRELTLRAAGDGVIAKGIELLEQALAIDPEFAECWAALAEAHLYIAAFTPTLNRVERAETMADCARKAIALDPAQAHARTMLGMYEFVHGNPAGALDLAFEAHRLAPNDLNVTMRLGVFLLYLGRARAALPYIEAAVEGDPVHGRNYAALCAVHLCLGDFDKSIAAGRRVADLGFPSPWLAVAYAANSDHERAVRTYYDLRTLLGTTIMRPPGLPPIDDAARDAYFMVAAKGICSGDPAARAGYCTLIDALHRTMADPYDNSIAYPAIFMGHAGLVMKVYGEGTSIANLFGLMALWVDVDPIRRTYRHPDFIAFAERIGFVAAWNKHGWPDLMPAVSASK